MFCTHTHINIRMLFRQFLLIHRICGVLRDFLHCHTLIQQGVTITFRLTIVLLYLCIRDAATTSKKKPSTLACKPLAFNLTILSSTKTVQVRINFGFLLVVTLENNSFSIQLLMNFAVQSNLPYLYGFERNISSSKCQKTTL